MPDSNIKVQVVRNSDHAQSEEVTGPAIPEQFAKRVKELGSGLGQIANDLRAQLDAALAAPAASKWELTQVQLAFSLDLEAEAGVILAKAKTTSGFEATLTWTPKPQPA